MVIHDGVMPSMANQASDLLTVLTSQGTRLTRWLLDYVECQAASLFPQLAVSLFAPSTRGLSLFMWTTIFHHRRRFPKPKCPALQRSVRLCCFVSARSRRSPAFQVTSLPPAVSGGSSCCTRRKIRVPLQPTPRRFRRYLF